MKSIFISHWVKLKPKSTYAVAKFYFAIESLKNTYVNLSFVI